MKAIWMGPRPCDAVCFEQAFDHLGVVSHKQTAECFPEDADITLFGTAEARRGGRRIAWHDESVEDLLGLLRDDPEGRAFLDDGAAVLPYHASRGSRRLAAEHGCPYLAPEPDLYRRLSDKRAVPALSNACGVPTSRSVVVDPEELTPTFLRESFPSGLVVVQSRFSDGGDGTYLVSDPPSLQRALERTGDGATLKVTEHVDGPVASITCSLDTSALHVGPVTRMVVNCGLLSPAWGTYSGNVFHERSWSSRQARIRRYAVDLSRHLHAQGHRGYVNFNFLERGPYLCDVNARCFGHMRILDEIQRMQGLTRFSHVHCRAHGNGKGSPSPEVVDEHRQDATYSLVVLHSRLRERAPVSDELPAGTYSLSMDGELRRESGSLDLGALGERRVQLVDPLPRAGTWVGPGSEVVRLRMRGDVLAPRENRLRPRAAEMVEKVYERMGLASARGDASLPGAP